MSGRLPHAVNTRRFEQHYVDVAAVLLHDCLLAVNASLTADSGDVIPPYPRFLSRGSVYSFYIHRDDLQVHSGVDGYQALDYLLSFRDALFQFQPAEAPRIEQLREILDTLCISEASTPSHWQGCLVTPETLATVVREVQHELGRSPARRDEEKIRRQQKAIYASYGRPVIVPRIRESDDEALTLVREMKLFYDLLYGLERLYNGHGHRDIRSNLISLESDTLETTYGTACPKNLILSRDVICGLMPGPSILSAQTAVTLYLRSCEEELARVFAAHDDHDLSGLFTDILVAIEQEQPAKGRLVELLRIMRSLAIPSSSNSHSPNLAISSPDLGVQPSLHSRNGDSHRKRRRQGHSSSASVTNTRENVRLATSHSLLDPDIFHSSTHPSPHPPVNAEPITPSAMPEIPSPSPLEQTINAAAPSAGIILSPKKPIATSRPPPSAPQFVIPTPRQNYFDIIRQFTPILSTHSAQFFWDVIFDPSTARMIALIPCYPGYTITLPPVDIPVFDPVHVRKVHFTTSCTLANYMMADSYWGPLIMKEKGVLTIRKLLQTIYDYFKEPIKDSELTLLGSWNCRPALESSKWNRNTDMYSYQRGGGGKLLRSDVLGPARRLGHLSMIFEDGLWKVVLNFEEDAVPQWWHYERYGH